MRPPFSGARPLLEQTHDTQLKGKTVDNLCDWIGQQDLADDLKSSLIEFLKGSESVKFTTGNVDPQIAEGRVGDLRKIVERLLA